MKQNQYGFGILGNIFLIVVIGIVVLVGYLVYSVNFQDKAVIHNAPAVTSNLQSKPQPQPVDNLHVADLPEISTASWLTFRESAGRISYKYPVDWQFKNYGLTYYGPSEATSDNKSTTQILTSQNGDPKADWGNNFKNLAGAQITIRVIDDHSSDTNPNPSDYCQTQPALTLEKLSNSMCVKMSYGSELYSVGASYCTLLLHADIILGGKNTVEQDKAYMQVLVAIGKSWNFKDVCTTDSQNVEHLYFSS